MVTSMWQGCWYKSYCGYKSWYSISTACCVLGQVNLCNSVFQLDSTQLKLGTALRWEFKPVIGRWQSMGSQGLSLPTMETIGPASLNIGLEIILKLTSNMSN